MVILILLAGICGIRCKIYSNQSIGWGIQSSSSLIFIPFIQSLKRYIFIFEKQINVLWRICISWILFSSPQNTPSNLSEFVAAPVILTRVNALHCSDSPPIWWYCVFIAIGRGKCENKTGRAVVNRNARCYCPIIIIGDVFLLLPTNLSLVQSHSFIHSPVPPVWCVAFAPPVPAKLLRKQRIIFPLSSSNGICRQPAPSVIQSDTGDHIRSQQTRRLHSSWTRCSKSK